MSAIKTKDDQLADAMEIIRQKNSELTRQAQTIKQIRRENDTAEAIRQEIWGLATHTPQPPVWVSGKGGNRGQRGAPITCWSDWHYGEVVDPEQIGGVNKFNAQIAKQRAKILVDGTIDIAFNHRGKVDTVYPGIVVCLGGDMISGHIHDELTQTNDRTAWQAVNDLTDLLAGCIDKIATKFGRVFLPCVVGNHGRGTLKPRNKGRVYTSFDWSIYCNLERHFKNTKTIQFMIPGEADAHFSLFGHRYLLSHGDALGVKGGDGLIGALGPIARGTIKVGRSEAQLGRDFDVLIMGHWHQTLWLPNAIVNNSLKGFDEYAHTTLRAQYSRPSQVLWFSHPEHGITDRWEVFLDEKRHSAKEKVWVSWKM